METVQTIPDLSIVSTEHLTKADREKYIDDLFSRIDEGSVDPLKAHLQLKSIEDILKRLTDRQKYKTTSTKWSEMVLEAAQKFGAKSFELMGAKVEMKEVGTSYDYSMCDDPKIANLHSQLEVLKEEVKARETFLQNLPKEGLLVTDEESGETSKIYPPAKKSTTSVVVTLK